MSTVTVRIAEELMARVAVAARRVGKTPHALIIEAIVHAVENVEKAEQAEEAGVEKTFDRRADERWAALLASGKSVAWPDARSWLEARARDERTPWPAPRMLKP